MKPRKPMIFLPMLAVCALTVLSACATPQAVQPVNQPQPAAVPTAETRTVIAAGAYENPPDIPPASMSRMLASDERTSASSNAFGSSGSRVSGKEAHVNVRSAPSAKSAVITSLPAGKEIRVLETRDAWVRITWMDGVTPRNGWMKKTFIESN